MKNIILTATITVLVVVCGFSVLKKDTAVLGGLTDSACTISSVTKAVVGHQLSSTILAASETRAWAIIQQPLNATNTVYLSFGSAATANTGIVIESMFATDTMKYFTFGKNTDFPYKGAVTGLTSTGSTTVHVVECNY